MRTRRTPAPRSNHSRTARLRRTVAAVLTLPLALGTLAATAIPASAGEPLAHIVHSQQAYAGVPGPATFTCEDTPERPLVEARWDASGQSSGSARPAAPSSGTFSFTADVVFQIPDVRWTLGLTCDYSSDESDASFYGALVDVKKQTLPTSTVVTFDSASVDPGSPVNVTATVTSVDGPATGGDMQFSVDGSQLAGTSDLDGVGTAVAMITDLGPGSHEILAEYSGYDTLAPSSSLGTVWVKVVPGIDLSVPASATSADVVLSATVAAAPGFGTPTGSVEFFTDQDVSLGETTLVGGQATLPIRDRLVPRDYEVFAVYAGDAAYAGKTSASRTMTVETSVPTTPVKRPSVVTVSVPLAITGSQVPVKVTVEPAMTWTSAGVADVAFPSGSVAVTLGKGGPRQTVTLVDGVATVAFDSVAPGTYEVEASYAGDEHFEVGYGHAPTTVTSPVVTPPVVTPPTTPAPDLSGSTSTLPAGGTITLIARDFLPGETVSFYLHSDPIFLGTAVADTNGVATLVVAIPAGAPAGEHHVRATGATSLRTAEVPVTVTAAMPVVTSPIVTVPAAAPVAAAPVLAAPAATPVAAAPLASTGVELGSTALIVSVLLGAGALLLVGRRRFAASAR